MPKTNGSVIDAVNPLHPGKPTPPEPAKALNHIALLVDESASMTPLRDACVKAVNAQVSAIKQASHESDQITNVSIYTFSQIFGGPSVRNHAKEAFPESVWFSKYNPNGDTPLNDAVREVVLELESFRKSVPQEAFLLIVLTDGEENRSTGGLLHDFVRQRIGQGNWTFAFLVPPGAQQMTHRMTGISLENIKEWEQTERGLEMASAAAVAGTQAYYGARKRGALSTKAFFTDLSKVKKADIKAMEDLSKDFRRWAVEKEGQISDECKAKTGAYEIGKAFYELMKPEEIQSHKEIVIGERKTRKLYGGEKARELLGIVAGPGVTVKVRPGNHADYRIFVQSTSMNRKLVRGTDLLYRK